MKRVLIFLLCMSLIGIIAGCGHIEDTNGTSTELETITMEKLTGTSISSSSSGVSTSSTRNIVTTMTDDEEIDVDELTRSGGKTSGVSPIMAIYLGEGEGVVIDSQVTIEEGNFKMVLISPSNELLHEFNSDGEDSFGFNAAESGMYIVRIGAESFSGEIHLVRTFKN